MKKSSLGFLNLFQYMMILFIVFIVQFAVSCACLALNKDQQVRFLYFTLVQVSIKGILYLSSLSLKNSKILSFLVMLMYVQEFIRC